jgi:hypothetical protein
MCSKTLQYSSDFVMSRTLSHHNLITLCHSGMLAIQTPCSLPSYTYVCWCRTLCTWRSTPTSVILLRHCLRCVLTSLALWLFKPLSVFHYAPPPLIICSSTYLLLFVLCYGSPRHLQVYKYFVLYCIPYLIINYKSAVPLHEVILSINY